MRRIAYAPKKITRLNLFWSNIFLYFYKKSRFDANKTTIYKRPMRAIWKGWRKFLPNLFFTVPYGTQGCLLVREGDLIQESIILSGFYESEVWSTFTRLLDQDEILWDIGANIGSISVISSYDKHIKLICAFEPQPRAIRILEENIKLNGNSKITLYPLALGEKKANLTSVRDKQWLPVGKRQSEAKVSWADGNKRSAHRVN